MLATIDTTYLSTIYVVLPFKFGRNGESYNEKLIKKIKKNFLIVTVLRIPKDFGPITKLLPVAKKLKKNQIR